MRAAIAAIILTLATSSSGSLEHTVLYGVSVGSVRVSTGPQTIPGLTEERLQSVVDGCLREAGIEVDPAAPTVLWVGATVVVANSDPRLELTPPQDAACFVTLDARLLEEARLVRNGLRVEASSWGRGAQVTMRVSMCADGVIAATRPLVADFVETFRAMNPARDVDYGRRGRITTGCS